MSEKHTLSLRTCRNVHGHCSECGSIMYDAPNYCPNCGAKVIEEKGKGNDGE